MTESALEKARRQVVAARIEFCALHRDACGDPPASYVQRIRDDWIEVENAIARLEAAARLAGRLEQAEVSANLCANTRSHSDCWTVLKDERDRLRREAEK